MAQYNISVSGNQLVVELIVTGGDFSPNVRTFKSPSIKLTPDTIKFNESGIYKMSLNFNEINEIGGIVPTDLEDAANLVTDLIANFNGGGASPEINAALLASENPSDTNPFATETWVDDNFQSILVSGTNIKTINGTSVLGSGDLTVPGGSGDGDFEFYGVVRYIPLTNTWELLNDAAHSSKNITSIISTDTTNGFKINPTYPSDALYNIGFVNITPDESLVRSGISAGASFGFTQITCPVVQNQGFGFIMNGTVILSDTTHIVPVAYELSWDATAMSLTLEFRGLNQQVGEGLGASNFNVNILPSSNSNFFFARYDLNYTPNGTKIKIKFYDLAGNVVTPTGRWLFNRTQPWQPLNNQLSKVGPNANFWVYGKYKKV